MLIARNIRIAALFTLLLVSACSTAAVEAMPDPTTTSHTTTFTIGDISDEPTKKIDRFQPLADYFVANLSEFGYDSGRVVIASSIEEMTKLIQEGQVDVYFDSPFPAITTHRAAGTQLILRRWKDGDASYRGIIIIPGESGLQSIDDIVGSVIAAEEPYSTTGFASQAVDLVAAGFELAIVDSRDSAVPDEAIGIWFSRDEENTIEAVLNGTVPAGFVSNQDLAGLPGELRTRLKVLSASENLPRQVVSVRGDLDENVVERVRTLLLQLEDTSEGQALLEQVRTLRFDEITPADRQQLHSFAGSLVLLP